MTRTDIHRPSAPDFDPEAYECYGVFDLYPEPGFGLAEIQAKAQAVKTAKQAGYAFAPHQLTGQCGHCGSGIRYAALMTHEASMEMIWVGETCLNNRFEALTKAQFHALREAAKLNKERKTAAERFESHLALAVEAEPSLTVLAEADTAAEYGDFIADLRTKMFKWELSPKQVAAAAKTIARQKEWAARKAEEAKTASPVPVTTKRIPVEGEVVGLKPVPNPYDYYGGETLKMTVRDQHGFKVYGTVPSSLDVERGDLVCFEAKVTPSKDDETFGYFSRPTKAKKLATKQETEEAKALCA